MNVKGYLSESSLKLSYEDFIIFIIPFIVFLVYLFIASPGILRFDSFTQLNEIATSNFGNWHPFFHTFIEMLCLKIYPNPNGIAFLQILTFSTIWTIICKYFRNEDRIRLKSVGNDFILQVILTLIISLIPINAIYSITLLKDTLFSYFLLLACFLVKVLLDKGDDVNYIFIIIFSLSMAFVAQLRHNGLYVILIFLIIFAFYLYKSNRSKKLYISIPALTIIFILLIASLNVAYEVKDDEKDAVFTKIVHMLADYDLNLTMEDFDRDKIHDIVNEKSIKEKYSIYSSDALYSASVGNLDKYHNDKLSYISLAIKYSLQNPLHFLTYMFSSSPVVWDVFHLNDWQSIIYSTDTYNIRDVFYHAKNGVTVPYYENVANNYGTAEFKALDSFVTYVKNNYILDTFLFSPALYMFLSLILMAYICILTKSKDLILVYMPNVLNILAVFTSTPIQDYRYLYPNLLLFYLFIIIFIKVWFDLDKKSYYISAKNPIVMEESENDEHIENNSVHREDSINIRNIDNLNSCFNKYPQGDDNVRQVIDNLSSKDILDEFSSNDDKQIPDSQETPTEMEKRIRAKILDELGFEEKK